MDKKQTLGIVLIVVLAVGMFLFNSTQAPEKPLDSEGNPIVSDSTQNDSSSVAVKDTNAVEKDTTKSEPIVLSDSARRIQDSIALVKQNSENAKKYGPFANFTEGKSECITLNNSKLEIKLCNKGGNVTYANLKEFTTWKEKPLILIDDSSSHISHVIKYENKEIAIDELYYTPKKVNDSTVTFTLQVEKGKSIVKTYTLRKDKYEIDYQLAVNGYNDKIKKVSFEWKKYLKRFEQLLTESKRRSWINYYSNDNGTDDFNDQQGNTEYPIQWIGHKQRFFNSSFISRKSMLSSADMGFKAYGEQIQTHVGQSNFKTNLPIGDIKSGEAKFTYYFGPNDVSICGEVTDGFEDNVYLGWGVFGMVNKWVIIPIFNVGEWMFGSLYGLIILFTVIIVKLLLFPIAFKSYKSTAKMKELKPEIEEIKLKYAGEQQRIQMETMSLYRKVGVNPMAGCIPVLLQMPILLALFNFFPNAIQLRHQSFLWAHDLSTYDAPISWSTPVFGLGDHISIFCLLMTIATLVNTYINNQSNASATGPMKNIGYIMPVMFFFILNDFAAGLTYYYFVSTMFTIGQQVVANKIIDKDKIRETLAANKAASESGDKGGKGGKKKSKFMQRLEEAQKLAEERKQQGKK